MLQETAQDTLTFRNNHTQTALPMRPWGSFLPGTSLGGGGGGRLLEWPDIPLPAVRLRRENG